MEPTELFHPDIDRLRALAAGQIVAPESVLIQAHLRECPRCCETIGGFPDGDTVLSRVRFERTGLGAPFEGQDLPQDLRDHPRYRVIGRLGVGGMGAVFKAEHRMLERPVVLKIIRPDMMSDPELRQRFERESRIAAQFSHPNIVTVYEAEQVGETYLLVMEFLDGENLDELVRKRGPLPVAVASELIHQAAVGLQHLHEHDLVQRDVKPSNLMLTAAGRLKVLDLGLAFLKTERARDQGLTRPQQSMGTVDYMVPEQWEDCHAVDTRADIYSLGCTLYCLLAGSPPFGSDPALHYMRKVWSHSLAPVPPIREKRPDVPAGLAAVLDRALAKQPSDRFAVPGEMAAALKRFAVGSDLVAYLMGDDGPARPIPKQKAVPTDRTGIGVPRRVWLAAAVALPVFTVGGIGLFRAGTAWAPAKVSPSLPGEPPVRIGILHSLTGTMSISERPVADARR